MKRLIMSTILGVAAMCCGSAFADYSNWFNGGIGTAWPTNTTMFGGSWGDGAETRATVKGETIAISADEEDPLVFAATAPKTLGLTAQDVAIEFRCAFQMFSKSSLPAVPATAKSAVILVTEEEDPDEATSGTVYFAAYDAASNTNVWTNSTQTVTAGNAVTFNITISQGRSGFLNVKYAFNGVDFTTEVMQDDLTVNNVTYVGAGTASKLIGAFTPAANKNVTLEPIPGLVVTNVTADGVQVGTEYGVVEVAPMSEVEVFYTPDSGYAFQDAEEDGIVNIGTVTADTTVNASTPGIPAVVLTSKYRVEGTSGTSTYATFDGLVQALRNGDAVTMLANDTIATSATIDKAVTFSLGNYTLTTAAGQTLTIAADVAFTASSYENIAVKFAVNADCTLSLPVGFDCSTITGVDYARVKIGDAEYVYLNGNWTAAGDVTMTFYYPYAGSEAKSGSLGKTLKSDDQTFVNGYKSSCETGSYYQKAYSLEDGELYDAYWFAGVWTNAAGAQVQLPERYVACDYYPVSTSVTHTITYTYATVGGEAVEGAVNPNPAGYSIETNAFTLADATAAGYKFLRWEKADGETVTTVDPIAIANGLLKDGEAYWDEDKGLALKGIFEVAAVVQYDVTITTNNSTVAGIEEGKVDDGTVLTFTVTPHTGYNVTAVTANGDPLTPEEGEYSYTVNGANVAIAVATEIQTFTVTFSTNTVNVAEATVENVNYGSTLEPGQIPSFTGGAWDVDPSTAVIVCATNFNYTIQVGPTPAPGSETKVDPVPGREDTYSVEPTGSSKSVSVSGAKAGDTFVIKADKVDQINGVDSTMTIEVTATNGVVISTEAFIGFVGETTFDATLNSNALVTVEGWTEKVPVMPTIGTTVEEVEPLVFGDEDVAATIRTIPGLTYSLKRGEAIGTYGDTAASKIAGAADKQLTLTDAEKPAGKAFYVIEVTK